jgi:hypothetical protein
MKLSIYKRSVQSFFPGYGFGFFMDQDMPIELSRQMELRKMIHAQRSNDVVAQQKKVAEAGFKAAMEKTSAPKSGINTWRLHTLRRRN